MGPETLEVECHCVTHFLLHIDSSGTTGDASGKIRRVGGLPGERLFNHDQDFHGVSPVDWLPEVTQGLVARASSLSMLVSLAGVIRNRLMPPASSATSVETPSAPTSQVAGLSASEVFRSTRATTFPST